MAEALTGRYFSPEMDIKYPGNVRLGIKGHNHTLFKLKTVSCFVTKERNQYCTSKPNLITSFDSDLSY